jgi:hypothetical protein
MVDICMDTPEARDEFVLTEDDCEDGLSIIIDEETGQHNSNLKTVMIHYMGQDFVLKIRGERHLAARIRTAFPDWCKSRTGRTLRSTDELQTGTEIWLIDTEDFVHDYAMDTSHEWWGLELTAFQIGNWTLMRPSRLLRDEQRERAPWSLTELVASRLKLSTDHVQLASLPRYVTGDWRPDTIVNGGWAVQVRAPETLREVFVQIRFRGQATVHRIRQRQSLETLYDYLQMFPRPSESCIWAGKMVDL